MAKMQCYLIESKDRSLLQKKIEELTTSSGFEGEEVISYDLEEYSMAQVLQELDTYSFLSPRKVVVIKQALFLMASDIKFSEEDLSLFLKYLQNPNPEALLLMGVSKCDERKKIVKETKKLVEVVTLDVDPMEIVEEELAGYEIASDASRLLVEYCEEDTTKLFNECEKLRLFALDTKKISSDDISQLVVKKCSNTEQLAFDFVKAIASKDKKQVFYYYDLLKEYHFEPHSMIGLIESQMKLVYQVLLGKRMNMKKDELAKRLKEHPFRIQKTLLFLPLYHEEEVRQLIHKLHDLDYRIKSGKIDATVGFEMFLIDL